MCLHHFSTKGELLPQLPIETTRRKIKGAPINTEPPNCHTFLYYSTSLLGGGTPETEPQPDQSDPVKPAQE